MVLRTLLLAWSVFIFPFSLSGQTESIAGTVHELRAVQRTDELGYTVPPEARPLLKTLKHQLRDLIAATIRQRSTAPQASSLQAAVIRQLRSQGVVIGGETETGYGVIESIQIRRPPGHRYLLVATTTLRIACGNDSSLYVFERRRQGWELILSQEANDYEEVKGAQGFFDHAISPPDTNGNWFAVTANVNPWCTSNWQSLRYTVMRPGPAPEEPEVLLKASDTIYLGVDEAYKLTVTAQGFSVDHISWFSLDPGLHSRVHLRRFQVKGKAVKRVPPFALQAHEFVDEWASMPWEQARLWVTAPDSPDLRRWHDVLKDRGRRGEFQEFRFVQPCRKHGQRWQIGLGEGPAGARLYFVVGKERGNFLIHSIEEQREPGCPGEARPPETPYKLP